MYLREYGSALIGGLMVLGCEINLVIHHCHSLFSNPHAHSPICVRQSGRVMSPPNAITQNSITPHRSEQAASDHQEGAQLDQVVVTYICGGYLFEF